MNIFIRTDASVDIGTGHVMRCLTVAQELQKRGHYVTFLMRKLPGHLAELVSKSQCSAVMLQYTGDFSLNEDIAQTIDILTKQEYAIGIIDHYQIDQQWENAIRPYVKKLVVIDDLADRKHDCDLLLDQNIVNDFDTRYDELVSVDCEKLLGPKYLILREEFTSIRSQVKPRSGEVKRLLVFMGGSDPTGETLKVMKAFQQSNFIFQHVDVVVGDANPIKTAIQVLCEKLGFAYHCQIDYLASLMLKADFSIGAGGSTTWERCYVGLPSSSTIVAENQAEATEVADSLGAVLNLGWHESVTVETYRQLIETLHLKQKQIQHMSQKAIQLTESPEGPNRWATRILEIR